MATRKTFLALATAVCALALVQVAFAAGLTITSTPKSPKSGKTVQMRVSGLKPGEKVKAVELIADGQQKTSYFPSKRANAGGIVVNTVRAEVKGKHTWTYTGRSSHRSGKTSYVVK
jgi:hypothetical protein